HAVDAQPGADRGGWSGKPVLGGTGGDEQQAYIARDQAGVFETIRGRTDSQRGNGFIRGGEAALDDSRGAEDPFGIRARFGGQLVVVHHARRQISAERPEEGHGFSVPLRRDRPGGLSYRWRRHEAAFHTGQARVSM